MPKLYPLVIGERERAILMSLMMRAAVAPTDYATMMRLAEAHARGQHDLGELNRGLTVELPFGYTVTFTHEEHKPGVMCRHASIGLRTAPGRGPTPEAAQMILKELGFLNRIGAMPSWLETLEDGTICPNFVEPLDGDVSTLVARRQAPRV